MCLTKVNPRDFVRSRSAVKHVQTDRKHWDRITMDSILVANSYPGHYKPIELDCDHRRATQWVDHGVIERLMSIESSR